MVFGLQVFLVISKINMEFLNPLYRKTLIISMPDILQNFCWNCHDCEFDIFVSKYFESKQSLGGVASEYSESESEQFTGETPNWQSFTRGRDWGKLVPSSHKRGELRYAII